MLREALKISSPLPLVSREVPRFHGGSLWHSTPALSLHRVSSFSPVPIIQTPQTPLPWPYSLTTPVTTPTPPGPVLRPLTIQAQITHSPYRDHHTSFVQLGLYDTRTTAPINVTPRSVTPLITSFSDCRYCNEIKVARFKF